MNSTHGQAGNIRSGSYGSWANMLQRCTNSKAPHYKRYGGRGIKVCHRWSLFENFYADMGDRPKGTTLDRKNNSLGYCKRNCKWSTPKEQAAHRRPKGFSRNNTSGITGVSWHKYTRKWVAHCKGKTLGYFTTKTAAAKARGRV